MEITVLTFMSHQVGNRPVCHLDNAALTQQLAAIINLVQNQTFSTQQGNKRSNPFSNQPAKRIQVVEADGSDPLGFDAPDTAKRPLSERAARVKYQVGKMIEGHAGKQARRESALTPKTVSTTDFVVRTRAQILADQKAQEEKEKAAKANAATAQATVPAIASTTIPTAPTTTPTIVAESSAPASAPVTDKNENSFDEDPEDEGAGDDSDFKDGSASDLVSSQTSPRLTESWALVSPNPSLFVPQHTHNHVYEWALFVSHPLGE